MKTNVDMDEERIDSNFRSTLQHNLNEDGIGDDLTDIHSRSENTHTDPVSEENRGCLTQDHLTVDALHPFFKGYANRKKDASTNTESRQFHCQECNSFIDLLQEQVIHHFSNKKHKPVDSCVYCRGAVFEYFYYEKRIVYHKCETSAERS